MKRQNKKTTLKPAPLLGKRGATPIPSFVENRLVELGIKQAQPSMYDAFIKSRTILSQIINPYTI